MSRPLRVVSLTCSNTEIVCALGCAELLVGVDDHSDFPPAVVDRLPRVGPDLQIDVGKVVALAPDLVLASLTVPGHEAVVAAVARAGLPFLAPEPTSLADVGRDVRAIAAALGVAERGEAVAAGLEAALTPSPAPPAGRPRILLQWWPKPVIVPGRLSWTTELIERAGGTNPLGGEPVKSRPVSDEEVRELAPDAMVLSWCGVAPEKVRPDVVYRNPAWQDLGFVRERRVFLVPEAVTGRPSPRLADGLDRLREVVAACR
ncbi:MAG TPA: helical backbone metal receptor [Thermoanaerobaculia bacterium]|nr:helical backbone metal receptor [Thermoanaerobaculia bacterium]